MGRDLIVQVYPSSPFFAAHETISQIVQAIDATGLRATEWDEFRIRTGFPGSVDIGVLEKGATSAELIEFSKSYSATPAAYHRTGTAIRITRFEQGGMAEGYCRLDLAAWDSSHSLPSCGIWPNGSAKIYLAKPSPYWARLDEDGRAREDGFTAATEQNLEDLLQIVYQLAAHLRPQSMKVFVDAGEFLPFNAHVAYYQSEEAVAEDCRRLAALWPNLPSPGVEGQFLDQNHRWIFSERRTDEQRSELWFDLNLAINQAGPVTARDIENILPDPNFDRFDLPAGFCILNYPYFMNMYIDRYIVAAFQAASQLR